MHAQAAFKGFPNQETEWVPLTVKDAPWERYSGCSQGMPASQHLTHRRPSARLSGLPSLPRHLYSLF